MWGWQAAPRQLFCRKWIDPSMIFVKISNAEFSEAKAVASLSSPKDLSLVYQLGCQRNLRNGVIHLECVSLGIPREGDLPLPMIASSLQYLELLRWRICCLGNQMPWLEFGMRKWFWCP